MAVPLSRKIGNDILRIGWVGVRGYGRKLWDLVKDLDRLKISLCFHPNPQIAIVAYRPLYDLEQLRWKMDFLIGYSNKVEEELGWVEKQIKAIEAILDKTKEKFKSGF